MHFTSASEPMLSEKPSQLGHLVLSLVPVGPGELLVALVFLNLQRFMIDLQHHESSAVFAPLLVEFLEDWAPLLVGYWLVESIQTQFPRIMRHNQGPRIFFEHMLGPLLADWFGAGRNFRERNLAVECYSPCHKRPLLNHDQPYSSMVNHCSSASTKVLSTIINH